MFFTRPDKLLFTLSSPHRFVLIQHKWHSLSVMTYPPPRRPWSQARPHQYRSATFKLARACMTCGKSVMLTPGMRSEPLSLLPNPFLTAFFVPAALVCSLCKKCVHRSCMQNTATECSGPQQSPATATPSKYAARTAGQHRIRLGTARIH